MGIVFKLIKYIVKKLSFVFCRDKNSVKNMLKGFLLLAQFDVIEHAYMLYIWQNLYFYVFVETA
jgi:hypothetical protein